MRYYGGKILLVKKGREENLPLYKSKRIRVGGSNSMGLFSLCCFYLLKLAGILLSLVILS